MKQTDAETLDRIEEAVKDMSQRVWCGLSDIEDGHGNHIGAMDYINDAHGVIELRNNADALIRMARRGVELESYRDRIGCISSVNPNCEGDNECWDACYDGANNLWDEICKVILSTATTTESDKGAGDE